MRLLVENRSNKQQFVFTKSIYKRNNSMFFEKKERVKKLPNPENNKLID